MNQLIPAEYKLDRTLVDLSVTIQELRGMQELLCNERRKDIQEIANQFEGLLDSLNIRRAL